MGDEPGTPDILYHYCSNATFLSIVESDSIRLSDLSLSNDSQEGRWVRKVFERYCRAHGVSDDHIDAALRDLDLTIEFIGAAGFCMSGRDDTLSQWRAYADDGFGVAIGFSAKHFVDVSDIGSKDGRGFRLRKILYEEGEQATAISEASDKIISYINRGALKSQYSIPRGPTTDDDILAIKNLRQSMWYANILFLGNLYTIKNPRIFRRSGVAPHFHNRGQRSRVGAILRPEIHGIPGAARQNRPIPGPSASP